MNDLDKKIEYREFTILKFRFSLKLNDILFPIDGREFADSLKDYGYNVQQGMPSISTKGRLSFKGPLAHKGEIIVDGNSERSIIGVTAKSCEGAITGFNEVNTLIKNEFGIDVDDGSRFFELITEFKSPSKKNSLQSLSQTFEKTDIVKNACNILEKDVSLFGFRLCSKGVVPNQEEWLDITIEPDIIKPDKIYNISVIFRSKDKTKVIGFGKNLQSHISAILDNVEK